MPNEKFYKNLLDNLSDGVYFVDKNRRITYWNKAAEGLSGRESAEVVGSKCADNILVHMDEKGRELCKEGCPLAATMEDGLSREANVHMLHKNGHRVFVNVKVSPLRNKSDEIIGGVETFHDNSTDFLMKERVHTLERLSLIDELTGAGNRRYADITLRAKFDELKRYEWPFGVIFSDIDDFKRVNDTYGHDIGDKVLIMVANTMKESIRNLDSLFRWGGEEFLAVVTSVDSRRLYEIAERMRVLVAGSILVPDKEPLSVTISNGATMASPEDGPDTIIKRADSLMYRSKASGKNSSTTDSADILLLR